jgi:hypothetical protein
MGGGCNKDENPKTPSVASVVSTGASSLDRRNNPAAAAVKATVISRRSGIPAEYGANAQRGVAEMLSLHFCARRGNDIGTASAPWRSRGVA